MSYSYKCEITVYELFLCLAVAQATGLHLIVSVIHTLCGAGVYIQTQEEVFTYPLGQHTAVFQAELFTILVCVNELRLTNETSIDICSDSQVALKALRRLNVTFPLMADTILVLKKLSVFHSVRLPWVPGYSNIPGNEIADVSQSSCYTYLRGTRTITWGIYHRHTD